MEFLVFNWADYVIIAILLLSIVIGLFRGLIREVFSLVTWVGAFVVGFVFSKNLANLFINLIKNDTIRIVVAFLVLFVVTLIIGGLISYLLSQLVQKTGLSGTDRMLGILFGFGRGALIVSLLLLVVSVGDVSEATWWKNSVLIPQFKPVVVWLRSFLPNKLAFDDDKQKSEAGKQLPLKN